LTVCDTAVYSATPGDMMANTAQRHRNPIPTVDILVEVGGGVVLIKRRNYPRKWAIPGGYVDYGESLEEAAVREAREETSLEVELERQLHTYSDPARDDRHHTVSTVFIARATGEPRAADDAEALQVFEEGEVPNDLAFDHARILKDYFHYRRTGELPRPGVLAKGRHEAADSAVDTRLATLRQAQGKPRTREDGSS
jgi:8-oxo-dGTP diphosphatase